VRKVQKKVVRPRFRGPFWRLFVGLERVRLLAACSGHVGVSRGSKTARTRSGVHSMYQGKGRTREETTEVAETRSIREAT
jgi:hypothetical protein